MTSQDAYRQLLRLSPEAAASLERMAAQGFSQWNVIHLLTRQYPSHIARLIGPAAQHLYQTQAQTA